LAAPHTVLIDQHGQKERSAGDPGLTYKGRQEAAAAGRWISEQFTVEALWSSPLTRAFETASEIARWVGRAVRTDERLRERTNWEGPATQSLQDFVAEWDRASADRSYVPQYGDSSTAAAERFLAALDDVRSTGSIAVVVAHGGVTVDALRTILGDETLLCKRPELISDGVPSGAITQLVWRGPNWEPTIIAATGHLAAVTLHGPS
jgi:broad specificity phosphatase PhoE